jgi:transcription initiation factor IIE alpha subunit
MGPRLSLPAKQLRRTLQLLQEEHLVKYELVDDLSSGGSQQTKFWYVDYNHAMNVIRLRIFLLRKKLEEAELRARSQSFYFCPGYKRGLCSGRYTETEAQQMVDYTSGLFLCRECFKRHENNPDPPSMDSYTLQLVDNTKDLNAAMDNIRRLNSQLSAKRIGNQQLRAGIYDLMQKVRTQKGPLSSNLPSENRAMGIGSKRLAGTGRTASIKAKKLAQQLGSAAGINLEGNKSEDNILELNFLKNSSGEKVTISLEKGATPKALLLCSRPPFDKDNMIVMVTTMTAGTDILHRNSGFSDNRERKRLKVSHEKNDTSNAINSLYFLHNNIGALKEAKSRGHEVDKDDTPPHRDMVPLLENEDQIDEEHRAAFQANYAAEITRQRSLLMSNTKLKMAAPLTDSSDILHMLSTTMECDKEVECNIWEDA